jgi:hypothetical protein
MQQHRLNSSLPQAHRHDHTHLLSMRTWIYSLCPEKNVILEILEQIIKEVNDLDCPYLFAILDANWLLHAYVHMHTCQIK